MDCSKNTVTGVIYEGTTYIIILYSMCLYLILSLLSCLNIIETNQYHVVCTLDSWYIRMINVWNIHQHLCSLLNAPVSYCCFVSLYFPSSKNIFNTFYNYIITFLGSNTYMYIFILFRYRMYKSNKYCKYICKHCNHIRMFMCYAYTLICEYVKVQ